MAREKKKEAECEHGESAPMWIVSFADLVTLLMSFFVVLAATASQGSSSSSSDSSSPSNNPATERVAVAIRAAFRDLSPDESAIFAENAKFEDLLRQLEAIARKGGPKTRGDSPEKGIYGEHFRVKRIRDGMEVSMGGPVFFDLLAAKINPGGREAIRQLADRLRGHHNMVDIRGHAGDQPRPADWTFQDAVELSYQRARAVSEELVKLGVEPRTIRLIAIGANEPVSRGSTDPAKLAEDRRVEVIIRESMLDDFATKQAESTANPSNRPVGMPATSQPYKPEKVEDPAPAPHTGDAESSGHSSKATESAPKASHEAAPAKH